MLSFRDKTEIVQAADLEKWIREAGEKTGLLFWGAGQTFNWAWWKKDVTTPAEYAEYYDPDPTQIRAINYFFAIGGARRYHGSPL